MCFEKPQFTPNVPRTEFSISAFLALHPTSSLTCLLKTPTSRFLHSFLSRLRWANWKGSRSCVRSDCAGGDWGIPNLICSCNPLGPCGELCRPGYKPAQRCARGDQDGESARDPRGGATYHPPVFFSDKASCKRLFLLQPVLSSHTCCSIRHQREQSLRLLQSKYTGCVYRRISLNLQPTAWGYILDARTSKIFELQPF